MILVTVMGDESIGNNVMTDFSTPRKDEYISDLLGFVETILRLLSTMVMDSKTPAALYY